MNLSELTRALERSDRFRKKIGKIGKSANASLSVSDAAKPYIVAALQATLNLPMFLVAARPNQARRFVDDLAAWHPRPESVIHFPVPDALPYEHLAYDAELTSARVCRHFERFPYQTPRRSLSWQPGLPWTAS